MQKTLIRGTTQYELTSYGNGTAYELKHIPTGKSVFVQDDDAIAFAGELDSLENTFPNDSTLSILHTLFCWYG